jgi:hypothetical protein
MEYILELKKCVLEAKQCINCVRHEKIHKSKHGYYIYEIKHVKIDLKSREKKKHLLSEYMNTLNTNTWILKM